MAPEGHRCSTNQTQGVDSHNSMSVLLVVSYLFFSAVGWYVIFRVKGELSEESRGRLAKDKVVLALLSAFCILTFPLMAVGALLGIVFEGWGGLAKQPKDLAFFGVSLSMAAFASYIIDRQHVLLLTLLLWLPALAICGLDFLAGKSVLGRVRHLQK